MHNVHVIQHINNSVLILAIMHVLHRIKERFLTKKKIKMNLLNT